MTTDVKHLRCVYQTDERRCLRDGLAVRRRDRILVTAHSGLALRSVGKTDLEGWGPLDGPAARVKETTGGTHCWFVPWDEWLAAERWAAGVGEE